MRPPHLKPSPSQVKQERMDRFIAAYRIDLNGRQAAIAAGYAPKHAAVEANRLLKNPYVKQVLAQQTKETLDRAQLTAERVLEEIRRLAFADTRTLFDAEGNLRPIHTLSQEEAACIAGFEVVKKNAQAGDGHIDTVHKVKIYDKTKAIEMAAKHFALLTERVEHQGAIQLRWKDQE